MYRPAHKKGPYGFSGCDSSNAHVQSAIGLLACAVCLNLSQWSFLHVCEQQTL